ncbi:MAG: hypothetical protein RMJ84_13765, partial [Sandaracinaceae bacterium]|nr:hypothetical protein [Sandaracinaceae bacterium]
MCTSPHLWPLEVPHGLERILRKPKAGCGLRNWTAWVLAFCLGCTPSPPLTQLVIVVHPNPSAESVSLEIVTPRGEVHRTMVRWRVGDVIPSAGIRWISGPLEPVRITAIGNGPTGASTARVRTGFVMHESRLVVLHLSESCISKECGREESCKEGWCVPAYVPPHLLPPWRKEVQHGDAGIEDARWTIQCPNGWADCDHNYGNACETNITSSILHCGGCNRACPQYPHASARCTNGRCEYSCNPGFADCNNNIL